MRLQLATFFTPLVLSVLYIVMPLVIFFFWPALFSTWVTISLLFLAYFIVRLRKYYYLLPFYLLFFIFLRIALLIIMPNTDSFSVFSYLWGNDDTYLGILLAEAHLQFERWIFMVAFSSAILILLGYIVQWLWRGIGYLRKNAPLCLS